MSDEPPGLNSPRRKSRFRSHYEETYHRPSAPKRPVTGEPEPVETNVPPADDLPPGAESFDAASLLEANPITATTVAGQEEDDLLPNFRLNKVYEAPPTRSNPLKDWRWLLVTATLLGLGVAGGYWLGALYAPPVASAKSVKREVKAVTGELSRELQAQVDAAFEATKKARYQEASELFAALHTQHPEWWSMGIESARASLYLHDAQAAQRALKSVTAAEGLPDSDFIMALLHLTNKEMDLAEASFALAVARDPARPDFYYFWGECLRRDGKPLDAVAKFRSALLRNQYENAEGLYQVKLWLSQIQSDTEESGGANKEIDAALATLHPPYEALFAAAAREMKAKRYPAAASFITRALVIAEPAVFRVIMQDPSFLEEANLHPELASFYR